MAVCAASLGFDKLVFVTNATYQGDLTSATQPLTGVAGGNADCQAEANAAGLPGTYKAWLSDSLGNSPSTTFTHSPVPYVLPDQNLDEVASSWAGLTSGADLLHVINVNAQGAIIDSPIGAWTSTNVSGQPITDAWGANGNCNNWTEKNHVWVFGIAGTPTNVIAPHWTADVIDWCDPVQDLMCFQQ